MDSILRRCKKCGRYTMRKDRCPYCGGELEVPHPPKFSPEDKYGRDRVLMKLNQDAVKTILTKLSQTKANE